MDQALFQFLRKNFVNRIAEVKGFAIQSLNADFGAFRQRFVRSLIQIGGLVRVSIADGWTQMDDNSLRTTLNRPHRPQVL